MGIIFLEFRRYFISTIIAFMIDISTLLLLTEIFRFYYMASAALAVTVGFSINYIINIKWVFQNRRFEDNPFLEYNYMVIISIVTSLVNLLFVWILTEFFIIYYVLSKLIASIFSFLLKFLIKRKFLFSHKL